MKFFFFKFKNSKTDKKKTKLHDKETKQKKRSTVGDFKLRCTVNHAVDDQIQAQSPSYSISSASTQSSLHTLHQLETRGIFRTLEPEWSFLPDLHDQWIPLAGENQRVLEDAFNANQTTCTLSLQEPYTKAIAHLSPSPSKKKRPATQLYTSSARHPPPQMKSSPNLNVHSGPPSIELYLGQNLRHSLVPCWWFEQDNEQGGKGMCRFDHKNQVRLEALSEGRSTLTLTDASFPNSFQVILDHANRSLKEECCGFMYLNPTTMPFHPPSPKQTINPLIVLHNDDNLYRDAFINRRCSI
ncbi:hypothetical protein BC941DRAFT_427929 [Chlamydoabsidia padenii]|nr:hypothetical protein BC941DRAFT_427929 [Chlamydoabsidia padenii]